MDMYEYVYDRPGFMTEEYDITLSKNTRKKKPAIKREIKKSQKIDSCLSIDEFSRAKGTGCIASNAIN
jgi:hypothetical protein